MAGCQVVEGDQIRRNFISEPDRRDLRWRILLPSPISHRPSDLVRLYQVVRHFAVEQVDRAIGVRSVARIVCHHADRGAALVELL